MPNLEMTIAHGLPQDEALRRIQTLLGDLKEKHADQISDLSEKWDGNTGTFQFVAVGFPVSGTLTVKPSEVEFCSELPLAAMLFKSHIESTIRERAEALLA